MANCNIVLKINNDEVIFNSGKSEEEWQDVVNLQEVTQMLLQHIGNSRLEKLVKHISTAIQDNKLIESLELNGTFQVPTHTGQELAALYPDENWGSNIPNVVLVNSQKSKYSSNYLYTTRLIHAKGDVYVVPKSNIRGFALMTRAFQVVEDLKSEIIETPKNIQKVYGELNEHNNNYKDRLLKQFHIHRESVLKDFLSAVETLNRGYKIKQREQRIQTLRTYINEHPKAKRDEELEQLEKELEELKLQNEQLLKSYKDNIAKLEEMKSIDNLENIELKYEDDRFLDIIEKYKYNKNNNNNTVIKSVADFIFDFITNKKHWEHVLSPEQFGNVKSDLDQLVGYGQNTQTSGIVYFIESKFKRLENYIASISVDEMTKILKDQKITTKKSLEISELVKLVKEVYSGITNYRFIKVENDNIYFKKIYDTDVVKYNYQTYKDQNVEYIEDYAGHFIYSTNIDNKRVYFASSIYLNKRTESNAYESLDELKQRLITGYAGKSLYLSNTAFLSNIDGDCELVEVSTSRYNVNNVLMGLDYPKGVHSIPENLTQQMFEEFIETRFKEDDARYLRSLLITDTQKALFYSYYRNFVSHTRSPQKYSKNIKEVLTRAEEISKANTTYFIVNQAFSKGPAPKINEKDTRTHYIRVSKIQSPFIQDVKLSKQQNQEAILVALSEIFNRKNIKVELYSSEQMEQHFGDKDIKGWHEGGIIFLNKDKASHKTALHEYSHLFIGTLRSIDEDKYNQILQVLSDEIQNPGFTKYYEEQLDAYNRIPKFRKLSEQGKRLYIAEEYFADIYAEHLSKLNQFGAIEDICNIVDNALVLSGIFPTLDINELLKSANNHYSIVANLSKEIQDASKRVGFSARLGSVRSTIESFIDNNITDNTENGIVNKC